jgi:hypothetical protein
MISVANLTRSASVWPHGSRAWNALFEEMIAHINEALTKCAPSRSEALAVKSSDAPFSWALLSVLPVFRPWLYRPSRSDLAAS